MYVTMQMHDNVVVINLLYLECVLDIMKSGISCYLVYFTAIIASCTCQEGSTRGENDLK